MLLGPVGLFAFVFSLPFFSWASAVAFTFTFLRIHLRLGYGYGFTSAPDILELATVRISCSHILSAFYLYKLCAKSLTYLANAFSSIFSSSNSKQDTDTSYVYYESYQLFLNTAKGFGDCNFDILQPRWHFCDRMTENSGTR